MMNDWIEIPISEARDMIRREGFEYDSYLSSLSDWERWEKWRGAEYVLIQIVESENYAGYITGYDWERSEPSEDDGKMTLEERNGAYWMW